MVKLKFLLIESNWDTIAKSVIKKAFDYVKYTYETYDTAIEDEETFRYNDSTLKFSYTVIVTRDKKMFKGDLVVDGGVSPVDAPNQMYIMVYINPKKEPLIYNKLYSQLHDVVRHELQHLTQSGPNTKPHRARPTSGDERDQADARGRFNYTMLPDEIEALVYGFFSRAKFERVPITTIFKNELNGWLKSKEITKEEYKKLYDVWIDFTKKHIPTAKLK